MTHEARVGALSTCGRGSGAVENITLPSLVEDADALDALLERDRLHHLVGGVALVREHGVPGGAGDRAGKLVGPHHHDVQQVALLVATLTKPNTPSARPTMPVKARTSLTAMR